jgi:predicted nuclease of predicted toxin-antitoxin system
MILLLDMNMSPLWLGALAEAGFEAVHWAAIGRADAADEEIMSFAQVRGWVILTQDLDFGSMLAMSAEKEPSVVQIRAPDALPDLLGSQVIDALRRMELELAEGALVTIGPSKTRLRVLPLRKQR